MSVTSAAGGGGSRGKGESGWIVGSDQERGCVGHLSPFLMHPCPHTAEKGPILSEEVQPSPFSKGRPVDARW